MPRLFRKIQDGIDIAAIVGEIDARPDIWSIDFQRQQAIAVQRETEAVLVFAHSGSETFKEARQREPLRYHGVPSAAAEDLPRTRKFVERLARQAHGRPGRAALVKLRPHGRVYPHIDRGLYYQFRDRYHLVLKSPAGSRLRAESDEVRMREGELWWFDNRVPHEAFNDADADRIHLIIDVLSPGSIGRFPSRNARQPRATLGALRRRLWARGNKSRE